MRGWLAGWSYLGAHFGNDCHGGSTDVTGSHATHLKVPLAHDDDGAILCSLLVQFVFLLDCLWFWFWFCSVFLLLVVIVVIVGSKDLSLR